MFSVVIAGVLEGMIALFIIVCYMFSVVVISSVLEEGITASLIIVYYMFSVVVAGVLGGIIALLIIVYYMF